MSHLREHGTRSPVAQSEPLRPDQVENSAGGYAWTVDVWTRLRRFLVLGTEGGSYYAGERALSRSNVAALAECIAEDGVRTVDEIATISRDGRAPKNDYAVFALAYAIAEGNDETKQAALAAVPVVCRIPTHLFQLADFLDKSFGKLTGRAKRRAIARWYTERDLEKLAYQLVKYRQREGWGHRDLLRLAHPAAKVSSGNPTVDVSPAHARLFAWVAAGMPTQPGAEGIGPLLGIGDDEIPRVVVGFARAQNASSPKETAELIREFGLPREAIQDAHTSSPEVWDALLEQMPVGAMVRTLNRMTAVGLIAPMSDALRTVTNRLADPERIRRSRLHPIAFLSALLTYRQGHGVRGSLQWTPVPQLVDALDAAFYLAFGNVEPAGKRTLLAFDISPSMATAAVGIPGLSARMGAAAMGLVTANVEPAYMAVAFAGAGRGLYAGRGGGVQPYPLSSRQRLDDVVAGMEEISRNYTATDCALPMLHALDLGIEVDTFVIYTDSETWYGSIHPVQALAEYRRQTGRQSRLVVCSMVANEFSIADPNDPGMLDVVGFDTAAPQLISDFSAGKL